MPQFPRTTVGGVSLPRMLIGTNWFLGYSHTSRAKDRLIREHMTRDRIADIMEVFVNSGIDAVMAPASDLLVEAMEEVQQRTGTKVIYICTPSFRVDGKEDLDDSPERILDATREMGATFCMPHQGVTDLLLDRTTRTIRRMDRYAAMIRERDMIPGLSTHMPETVVYADETGLDVETYIQLYNAAGFLLQVETDWIMRIIQNAKKPVMTIKPLAAGRLLPAVGLSFVWSTIRDIDMVTVGTFTPDEAREVIDLSLEALERRESSVELQRTRSKASIDKSKE